MTEDHSRPAISPVSDRFKHCAPARLTDDRLWKRALRALVTGDRAFIKKLLTYLFKVGQVTDLPHGLGPTGSMEAKVTSWLYTSTTHHLLGYNMAHGEDRRLLKHTDTP